MAEISDDISLKGLKMVIFPVSITKFPNFLFKDSDIRYIEIPSNVVHIGDKCFANCQKLCFITIPENVVNIGDSCFENCTNLLEVRIEKNCHSLEKSAIVFGHNCFENCLKLLNLENNSKRFLTFKDGEENAFMDCYNFKKGRGKALSKPPGTFNIGISDLAKKQYNTVYPFPGGNISMISFNKSFLQGEKMVNHQKRA